MHTLKEILTAHAEKYPLMQPQDAVKLLYQNEFGGAHLITDEAACIRYLQKEYEATPKDPAATALEEIGNGFVRVMLAALPEAKLDRLGAAFLRSAAMRRGTLPNFLQKLELLRELTQSGIFGFNPAELEAYLQDYAQAGYPMVSHSSIYRNAYHPAYRIVLKNQWNFT